MGITRRETARAVQFLESTKPYPRIGRGRCPKSGNRPDPSDRVTSNQDVLSHLVYYTVSWDLEEPETCLA